MDRSELERDRFRNMWSALGGTGDAVFDELVRRYAEPGRRYHTAEHVVECLAWLDRVRHLARDAAAVEAAIWFHDAVHDPLAADNEARSAALFRTLAGDAGVADDAIEPMAKLIEATDHRRRPELPDARLLVDIDLCILGAPPARYRRYEQDVRAEYAVLDDEVYRIGRRSVLRGFLERTAIFHTDYFGRRLESQARDNLAEAVRALD